MPQEFLTLVCTCGGSQDVPLEWMKTNPSYSVNCRYLRTVEGERIGCDKSYKVMDLLKAWERGRRIFEAQVERQISMDLT